MMSPQRLTTWFGSECQALDQYEYAVGSRLVASRRIMPAAEQFRPATFSAHPSFDMAVVAVGSTTCSCGGLESAILGLDQRPEGLQPQTQRMSGFDPPCATSLAALNREKAIGKRR